MSFLALKRYLYTTDDVAGYRTVIRQLLNAIAKHPVVAEPAELESFRADMQRIVGKTTGEPCLEEWLFAGGAAVQAMDSYNSRASRFLRQRSSELHHMLAMMAQTILTISGGNDRMLGGLAEIKNGLDHAVAIQDMQALKAQLGECLAKVQEETSRQRAEAESAILELQNQIHVVREHTLVEPDIDPATGLPSQRAAEAALRDAFKTPGRKYLVTAVLDRYQLITTRFGEKVANEMLKAMGDHLERNLTEGDRLFRWTGPAIVGLLSRQDTIDHVRSTLRRVFETRLESEFDIGGRTVLVPVSCAWSVIATIPPVTNTINHIQKFVAAQVPREC